MRLVLSSSVALLLAGFTAGCTSDDYMRSEGVTSGAGEAQAANTVMQMVDPWKYGVQNTRLLVPAERGSTEPVTAEQAASAKASQASADN
ncbi:hypothetical protein LB566_19270 [Mesorhizobium sp. CA13]|jgi:hypothetical protein|uniref:hypothetical protein n=1 Tax=unclassified Mesorhizobium TaxID=325217 RepID=UPI00112B53D8|nr:MULTISPECIES: hypothetical protein [unclassified Mesorhizobium]MBZ9855950.1 hypothetical protein [Mesorhizobium sp. CA13]MCA0013181.1 hypothetical protein [Mesorhizobium sp. B294B1A1]MCA0040161.1 hypothetical protein [Mesorhizobium sp. B292B1B]TPM45246.1 hypothetical protein FJ964_17470 [Mesorhizobium sp. B2-3-2]